MDDIYKNYLFQKHILVSGVSEANSSVSFETLFSLANLFGIRIVSGEALADGSLIPFAASLLGVYVPEPFYRGFPESVRELTREQLLFDQLLHYARTYGFGDFSEPGHSAFEAQFERTAFKENITVRDFSVVTEAEALEMLKRIVGDLLAGTRPLNEQQYQLVQQFIRDYRYVPDRIASKNTAVRLLLDLKDADLAKGLMMSDVIKLVEEMNYRLYGNKNIRKLNLKNSDRKFVTAVMDTIAAAGKCDIKACCEKKQIWNGLLHHLHYKARTDQMQEFVNVIRGRKNISAYAGFEKYMAAGDAAGAAGYLKREKGAGAILRKLNYLASRCEDYADLQAVLECVKSSNAIILIQLLQQYAVYHETSEPRTFKFTKFNQLKVHWETKEETAARRSRLTAKQAAFLSEAVREMLQQVLRGRLNKVYIDPDMVSYALPVGESASQGGFGVLPKGTRLPVKKSKVIRAFTYWEKVNDIDLSVIGLDEEGRQTEFSWRTMAFRQAKAITYSGDQTSGYHGGSEYFDIHVEAFRKDYPGIRYLVFCDNVFSSLRFNECYCRAGYMLRDAAGSGQVFEPKTVQSAFTVNCDSRFAYLFGLDLDRNEFIWLNMARDSDANVAGGTPLYFLLDYFHLTDVINMHSFFEMLAEETTDSMEEADVIVTNKPGPYPEGPEVIREYDFEKVMALMNAGRVSTDEKN